MSPRNRKKNKPLPYIWIKRIVGILLLFPSFLATVIIADHLRNFTLTTPNQLTFITGAGVYLVVHLLLWKPIFMHVMGHELTHAFWAVLLGGRIKSLLVSREGGQVTLSKTNFFIALAPYFFPLYTFILLPIYLIAAPKFYAVLSFFIGFTLAFHVALTMHSLRDQQSDVAQVGAFFSLIFVYFMNLLVMVIVLSVISPDTITMPLFLREMWHLQGKVAWWLFDWVSQALGVSAP